MDDAVETIEYRGHQIRVHTDENSFNPRKEFDNLNTMYCSHCRYLLGDVQVKSSEELKEKLQELGPHLSLPLYLYDHSGITMNTTGYSCPWDSGQVGIIAISIAKIKKVYGWKVLTKARREQILGYLRNEVEQYDQYLTGEVYGYVIRGSDEETIDSCWGFYGSDHKASGLLESARGAIDAELDKVGEQQVLAVA